MGSSPSQPKTYRSDPFPKSAFPKIGGGKEEIFSLWPRTYWIHFQGCWKCSDCKDNTWGCMRDEIGVNLCHPKGFWNFLVYRSKGQQKKKSLNSELTISNSVTCHHNQLLAHVITAYRYLCTIVRVTLTIWPQTRWTRGLMRKAWLAKTWIE